MIEEGKITATYCPTENMIVEIFTKVLDKMCIIIYTV